jgi:hypothetical protein
VRCINQGVELRAFANVVNRGKFSWNTDFNFTFIENEVTNLVQPLTGTYNRTEVGGPIAQLYGFKWAGVNPSNGNAMYYSGENIVQLVGAATWRAFDPANPAMWQPRVLRLLNSSWAIHFLNIRVVGQTTSLSATLMLKSSSDILVVTTS